MRAAEAFLLSFYALMAAFDCVNHGRKYAAIPNFAAWAIWLAITLQRMWTEKSQ